MTMPANNNDSAVTTGNSVMLQGHVRFFDLARGYGFIQRDDDAPDVFIHINAFAEKTGDRTFNPHGVRVEFEIGTNGRTGKPCAINVRLVE